MESIFDFSPDEDMPMDEAIRPSIPPTPMGLCDDIMTMAKALYFLKTKDAIISLLQNEMNKLRSECEEKNVLISQQLKELQRLKEKDQDTFTLSNMEDAFDLQKLDKVVGDLTCNIFDRSLLAKRKRFSIILNVLPTLMMGGIAKGLIDLHATQDSLSFRRGELHHTLEERFRSSKRK